MNILGIDASLVHPAWAWGAPPAIVRHDTEKAKLTGVRRWQFIRDQLREWYGSYQPQLVVLENYSFASTGNAGIALGELGGILRMDLAENPNVGAWTTVTPQTRAKFATGKTQANKVAVASAVSARTGIEFTDDDSCDAFVMWCMGREAYGLIHPLEKVPQLNKEAMHSVLWPDWLEIKPRYDHRPPAPKKRAKKAAA